MRAHMDTERQRGEYTYSNLSSSTMYCNEVAQVLPLRIFLVEVRVTVFSPTNRGSIKFYDPAGDQLSFMIPAGDQ